MAEDILTFKIYTSKGEVTVSGTSDALIELEGYLGALVVAYEVIPKPLRQLWYNLPTSTTVPYLTVAEHYGLRVSSSLTPNTGEREPEEDVK